MRTIPLSSPGSSTSSSSSGAAPAARARLGGWAALPLGALLGFSLSRIGFTDYTQLHRMFTFADLRMFFVFCGGVVVTAALLFALRRARPIAPKPFTPGVVIGGVLFGAGWAIAGACPGAALAQLGEGKVWALASLFGIALGTALADRVLTARAASQAPATSADLCGT